VCDDCDDRKRESQFVKKNTDKTKIRLFLVLKDDFKKNISFFSPPQNNTIRIKSENATNDNNE